MEKGFRTVRCHGCMAKLQFRVSEKDYGDVRLVRCPRCKCIGRVTIPFPPKTGTPDKKPPSGPSFEDLFGDVFSKKKPD